MLYQDHRPKKIEEMLGNEKVLTTFAKHFSNAMHSHAHVITGPRGCGKTTLARIAAKEFLGADDLGIMEINCGTERGIAAMKDVIELATYRPPTGKARVFILDEAHSLLAPGKKALLKPTEDCPDFTYYFFCTTDPDALFSGDAGKALKSRLTPWCVRALNQEQIGILIDNAAAKYNIPLDAETRKAIVLQSDGSPREALVKLEQVIGGGSPVTEKSDTVEIFDFCKFLYGAYGKPEMWLAVGAKLRALKNAGVAAEGIRHTALALASSTLMSRVDPAAVDMIDIMSSPLYDQGEAFPKLVAMSFKICHCTPAVPAPPKTPDVPNNPFAPPQK